MSETTWSPEPWRIAETNQDEVRDANGDFAAEGWAKLGGNVGGFDEKCAANARRIVACVNALAGIPTEALESGALGRALGALYGAWHGDRALGRLP